MTRSASLGKILVVDDDDLVSSVLSQALEREGYEVRIAEDMADALVIFSSYRADVVLTDLLMPGGTGIDLLQKIEQIDPLVPVIIITADDSVDWAAKAVRTRAYDYLTKPVGRRELISVVTKAVSERRHTQLRRRQQQQLRHDHRELEIQLARRSKIFSLVFDRTAQGIIIWNSDLQIVEVSGSFLELSGRSELAPFPHPPQLSIDDIFEPHPAEGSVRRHIEALLLPAVVHDPGRAQDYRDSWVGEVGIIVPHGAAVKARLRVYACEVPESEEFSVDTPTNLEDAQREHMRTRYAVGLIDYDQSQEQLSRQLQRADKLASTAVLAGSAAHEIKNDLGPLLGYLSMMEHLDSDGMVESMRDSAQRIREHVDQILAPLRHRRRSPGPVGFASVVDSTIEGLRRAGRLRRIALRIEQPEQEVLVHADRDELHQIIMNLVTNAADSLGDGGGGHRGSVEIRIENQDGYGCLEVRDDGEGIPEALQARIFEPFYTTKGRGGTGLGLPVVHDIVRSSRGTVSLVSSTGEGTTVRVRLPLFDTAAHLRQSDATHPDARASRVRQENKKVDGPMELQ